MSTSSYSVLLAEWGRKFNMITRFWYKSTPKDIPQRPRELSGGKRPGFIGSATWKTQTFDKSRHKHWTIMIAITIGPQPMILQTFCFWTFVSNNDEIWSTVRPNYSRHGCDCCALFLKYPKDFRCVGLRLPSFQPSILRGIPWMLDHGYIHTFLLLTNPVPHTSNNTFDWFILVLCKLCFDGW